VCLQSCQFHTRDFQKQTLFIFWLVFTLLSRNDFCKKVCFLHVTTLFATTVKLIKLQTPEICLECLLCYNQSQARSSDSQKPLKMDQPIGQGTNLFCFKIRLLSLLYRNLDNFCPILFEHKRRGFGQFLTWKKYFHDQIQCAGPTWCMNVPNLKSQLIAWFADERSHLQKEGPLFC